MNINFLLSFLLLVNLKKCTMYLIIFTHLLWFFLDPNPIPFPPNSMFCVLFQFLTFQDQFVMANIFGICDLPLQSSQVLSY